MLNRKLEVKMVKSNKTESQDPAQPEPSLEEKVATIGYYAERIVKKAGQAALAYVAIDTIRQVVVAKALKP